MYQLHDGAFAFERACDLKEWTQGLAAATRMGPGRRIKAMENKLNCLPKVKHTIHLANGLDTSNACPLIRPLLLDGIGKQPRKENKHQIRMSIFKMATITMRMRKLFGNKSFIIFM